MQHKILEELDLDVYENGDIFCITNGKPELLKQYNMGKCTHGAYKAIVVYRNGKRQIYYVHRLVASAFISNPYQKPYVNHIDGNPANNNVNNLEWVTNSENLKHAYDNFFVKHKCLYCGRLTRSKSKTCHTCQCRIRYRKNAEIAKKNKRENLNEKVFSIDFSNLTDKQKDLLELKLNGFNQSDIARMYGISRQAISVEFKKIFKNIL